MDDSSSTFKVQNTMRTEDISTKSMPGDEMEPTFTPPQKTGRMLVLFDAQQVDKGKEILNEVNIQLAATKDARNGSVNHRLYSELGVAVIRPDKDQFNAILQLARASSDDGSPILMMAEETVIGVDPKVGVKKELTTNYTWGLKVTNVIKSELSGKGIKVAILDTGFDLKHPDFQNREIIYKSFVGGQEVQDGHGHGTHCTGTACGPRLLKDGIGYGVAYEAEIYIGKVLGNNGKGDDGSIIEGINWAVERGCEIVSMSIGGLVAHGQEYPDIYEHIAARALQRGTLIVAAAGNDSQRELKPAIINPVSYPGNCPSILAVGAIDKFYKIAWFSNGEKSFKNSGEVDIAGPGVDVYSSWPMNQRRYNTISGTSMATPHVAGIAALYAQKTRTRGKDLWELMTNNAERLEDLDSKDVGSGLIQAPKL